MQLHTPSLFAKLRDAYHELWVISMCYGHPCQTEMESSTLDRPL